MCQTMRILSNVLITLVHNLLFSSCTQVFPSFSPYNRELRDQLTTMSCLMRLVSLQMTCKILSTLCHMCNLSSSFCFSSFYNVSLVTNIFFHLFQLSKKYYCNLYWWVYYMPLLVFHKENLFELSQFLIPLYLSNSWLIILSLFTVAPICYAHLAASQMGQFIKFEDSSDTSITSAGSVPVPELPRLHKNVESSMFFCWDTDCFS